MKLITFVSVAAASLAVCLVQGCYGVPAEEEGATQPIVGGYASESWQWRRAATLRNPVTGAVCSATIIGPRHLLTAAHCRPAWGSGKAYFYNSPAAYNAASETAISTVTIPPGVNPGIGDYIDTSGRFADVAVLRLAASVPSTSEVVSMAWQYHGANDGGFRVGAGQHDGASNPALALRTNGGQTFEPTSTSGFFHTLDAQTNPGDDGGPFYRRANQRQLGVLSSRVFGLPVRDKYTTVPTQLPFILGAMGYTGAYSVTTPGGVPASYLSFTPLESELLCRYACDQVTGCAAFSWVPSYGAYGPTCFFRASASGSFTPMAGAVTGVRL